MIENHCNGLGDATVYCWLIHSLRAAGIPVLMNPAGRGLPIYDLFSIPPEWRSTKPGALRQHPPKAVFPSTGWLSSWITGHGFPLVPFVRPPYTQPDSSVGERALSDWHGRGHPTLPRILICPDVMYSIRRWPASHYALLARWLTDAGFQVLVLLHHWDPGHPYPYAIGGVPVPHMIELIRSADLLICNDSGPAHIGGTLNTRTLALCGPSPHLFFSHLPSVTTLHVSPNEVPCVECNFQTDRGWGARCNAGCAATAALTPLSVLSAVHQLLGFSRSSDPSFIPSRFAPLLIRGEHRLADEVLCSSVFHHDTYLLRELPFTPRTIIDVGANIGSFAARCRVMWPDSSLIAVEADPANHEVLRLSRPDFIPKAVHYGAPQVSIVSSVHPGTTNTGGSHIEEGEGVPTTTLESLLDGRGWPCCDLLKLDCEGSEFNILENCDLSRFRCIIGEYHDQKRWDALRQGRLSGWRVRILRTGGGLGEFWLTPPNIRHGE